MPAKKIPDFAKLEVSNNEAITLLVKLRQVIVTDIIPKIMDSEFSTGEMSLALAQHHKRARALAMAIESLRKENDNAKGNAKTATAQNQTGA